MTARRGLPPMTDSAPPSTSVRRIHFTQVSLLLPEIFKVPMTGTDGLPRHYAPRNDGRMDCHVTAFLAMTQSNDVIYSDLSSFPASVLALLSLGCAGSAFAPSEDASLVV